MDDDVYSLGLIILETIAGPLQAGKEEAFSSIEMVLPSVDIQLRPAHWVPL